jgi:hypothetical protein
LGLASGVSAAFHIFARSCKASFVNREKVKIIKKISQCRDDGKPELFSLKQQKLKTHADGLDYQMKTRLSTNVTIGFSLRQRSRTSSTPLLSLSSPYYSMHHLNNSLKVHLPLQGVVGGLPTNPASHSQRWLPGRLVQTELGPQGFLAHSSMSTQVAPKGWKPLRQKHWPSRHSALLTQSKFPLQTVATST